MAPENYQTILNKNLLLYTATASSIWERNAMKVEKQRESYEDMLPQNYK